MAARLPKACRVVRCAGLSTEHHGYCAKHIDLASWGKHQIARGKSPYNSSAWRRTRAAIIKRDMGLCQECKRKGIIRSGTECDHIVSLANGGSMHSHSNLQLLCKQCHRNKTALESH